MTQSPTDRGYGWQYQKARAKLLAGGPPCYWCGAPATTADHEPPMHLAGPHLNLVPACAPCNYGRRSGRPKPRPVPTPSPRSRVW